MWQTVHGYLYSVTPFILLAIFNLLLLQKLLLAHRKNLASRKTPNAIAKKRSMSKTVLFVTSWFILITLPHSITGGYYWENLYGTDYGRLILYVTQSLQFTHHSANFVMLYVVNKKFKKEIKQIFVDLFGKKSAYIS